MSLIIDCREAHQLYQFAQSVEISPELEEIKFDMGMASQDNSKLMLP